MFIDEGFIVFSGWKGEDFSRFPARIKAAFSVNGGFLKMSEVKTNVTINVDPVTGRTSVVGFDSADTKESYDLLKRTAKKLLKIQKKLSKNPQDPQLQKELMLTHGLLLTFTDPFIRPKAIDNNWRTVCCASCNRPAAWFSLNLYSFLSVDVKRESAVMSNGTKIESVNLGCQGSELETIVRANHGLVYKGFIFCVACKTKGPKWAEKKIEDRYGWLILGFIGLILLMFFLNWFIGKFFHIAL